jgi:rhomboid family GlyGly-CTERM serine protease
VSGFDQAAWRPGLALLGLCLLPLLLPERATAWLEYRSEAVLAGEVWRFWSGHFMHYAPAHAVLDGAACLILATGLQRAGTGAGLLLKLAAIAPIVLLAILLAVPDMTSYRGASGLAMALLAALLLTLWRAEPRWRIGLAVFVAALLVKLAADAMGYSPVGSSLPDGIRVAWQANVAGLVCGLLFWWRVARK